MKNVILYFWLIPAAIFTTVNAQVGINTITPEASSILDVTSTNKGVLIPRMTEAQRIAISSPATGLLVYQIDNTDGFWYYDGSSWVSLSSSNAEFQSVGGVVQNTTSTATDDFVFGSTSLEDLAGTSDDYKVLFDKSKGAFRAGYEMSTNWDDANRGNFSIGLGNGVRASGTASFASGINSIASGNSATAMGSSSYALADYATAIGNQSFASGSYSVAIGNQPQAYGLGAISLGYNGVSNGYYSFAAGFQPYAYGDYSTGIGYNTEARSYGEIALGYFNSTYTPVSTTSANSADRLLSIGNGTSSARSNALTLLKSGRLGLGVDIPAQKLDIVGASGNGMLIRSATTAANVSGQLWAGTTGFVIDSRLGNLTGDRNLHLRTGGVDRLFIENTSGEVGIGTTVPLAKLDIVGSAGNGTLIRSATTAANVSGHLWAGSTGFVIDSRLGDLTGDRNLHLQTGGVDRLFIENTTGQIGIGTTAPVSKLDIVATAGQGMTIRSATTATNVAGFLWSGNSGFVIDSRRGDLTGERDIYFQTGGNTRVFIERTTGEVGIGTTTPNYLLEVNGTAGKPGGGFWTATSDIRLKKNVQDFKMGLDELLQINPVTYQYNDLSGFDTQKTYTGVIAQELQKIIPQMIGFFEKEGSQYLNVDGSAFTYILINSVKELAQKKDDLGMEITALKDKLNTLEKRLLLLESKKE
ncbi:MAG: tail fiber domain-containing protein [Flavobacteriaceae bacterium]